VKDYLLLFGHILSVIWLIEMFYLFLITTLLYIMVLIMLFMSDFLKLRVVLEPVVLPVCSRVKALALVCPCPRCHCVSRIALIEC